MPDDFQSGDILYVRTDYNCTNIHLSMKANQKVYFLTQEINTDGIKCYLVILDDKYNSKVFLPYTYFSDTKTPQTVLTKLYFDWLDRYKDLGAWIYDTDMTEFDSMTSGHYFQIRQKGSNSVVDRIYTGSMTERFNE